MTPDHSAELERLRSQRQWAEARLHPGWLSASGRHDRREIERIDAELAEVTAAQAQSDDWLATNANVLAYRDQLKAAAADRRHELGFQAAVTQPMFKTLLSPGSRLHAYFSTSEDQPGYRLPRIQRRGRSSFIDEQLS